MAEADTIVYRVREGTVALRQATPAVRRLARVHSDSLRVDGIEIDLDTSSEDLRARGDLDVRLQPPAAAPHERAGLFESGEEIVGTGAALTYVKRTGAATFDGASGGSARLSQGTTIVTGARVRLDNQSQNLSASGSVTTTWIPPVEEGRASPRRPVVATADRFAYDSTKRTAEYEAAPGGPLVSLTSADGECRGERIVLRLSAGSSRIAGLTVERQVSALIEGGYEVVGDLLTFDAPTDIYVLSGTPARVRRLSTTGRGQPGARCEVNETAVLELNRGKGTVASRSARVPLASLDLPCDAPLRVPR
jgi:lipopolysaccharide export system protein LptA